MSECDPPLSRATAGMLARWRSVFRLTLLAVGASSGSYAAPAAEDKPGLSTYTVDEVVVTDSKLGRPGLSSVATGMPVPIHLTPASVGVVGQALIASRGSTVLGDALENLSGITVHTGFGVHDYFVIRGFDSLSSGLVLVDGAAEPQVSFYQLYNVERVEVLKGPGAFLYGGSPLSGAVDLVRKQPLFDNFARLTGSYGRFRCRRGVVDLGGAAPGAGLAFRLNALWQASDGYRDDKQNSSVGINPALTWRLNDHTSVQLNLEYAQSDYSPDAGLPLVGGALPKVPRQRSYQSPFDRSDQDIYRVRVDLSTRISPSVEVRNKLYYTDFGWDSRGTLFTGPDPAVAGQVGRSLTLLDDRQKYVGNQFEVVFDYATGPVAHTLMAGLELARLGDEFTLDVALLPPVDVLDPVETAAAPLVSFPNQAGEARSLVFAPYAVDRLSLSERYQVFLGGRFDAIDYGDEVADIEESYHEFSPLVGLVYTPLPSLAFYGNAGRAFAPPSVREQGARRAEASTQLELGVRKQLFGGRLGASLAAYQLSKDVHSDDGATSQQGHQRSRGVELELAAQPLPGWRASFAYAFCDAELTELEEVFRVPTGDGGLFEQPFDRSGNAPAFAPEHLLSVWTTGELRNGLGAGLGAHYVGRQFIAADNGLELDGALTFDAALHYRFGRGLWRVNLENLTNRMYETRGFGAASVIPADPFALRGSLAWAL